jgi:hypothetical protein
MKNRMLARSLGLAALISAVVTSLAHASSLGFTSPIFVNRTLGGGEPSVAYAVKSGLLVYSSHEGTTHLFTSAAPGAPAESGAFIAGYHNQVNIWTSADNGRKWSLVPFGKATNPFATGFSDPDLTQDSSGNIYNTGIDLANDALFSSQNGGKTWPTGTAQCHDGDRPWLAGGGKNEVFLSTDTNLNGHEIFHSTNAGASCSKKGIPDQGTVPKGQPFAGDSYAGQGKLYYDYKRGNLVEGIYYKDSSGKIVGVGFGILKDASHAFSNPKAHFVQVPVAKTTAFSHWPAIAIDSRGNYYMVWDTDNRNPKTQTGCPGSYDGSESFGSFPPVNANTPLANRVLIADSTDGGLHWTKPRTVAYAPGHRLLWPWITAGSAGRVGVVWYEYDRIVDPDCAPAAAKVYVMAAEITGATGRHFHETVVNASGRSIHTGTICAGGTACAATNVITKEDRRLGDYFTVNTNKQGCLMIASGDTTLLDPLTHLPSPTSHPIFMLQNMGIGLFGLSCGGAVPPPPPPPHHHHHPATHHHHHKRPTHPSKPPRKHKKKGFTG